MTEPMSYVYAITRAGGDAGPGEVTGIGDRPVRAVRAAGVVAWVSTVDAADFGEEGLREHFEDVRWLESTARAHNRVIGAVPTPVAPLSLATVYYSDDRVREVLTGRAGELLEVLDRITGRIEWGVKAFADPPAETPVEQQPEEESSKRPGSAYLERIRRRREGAERHRSDAADRAERLHRQLVALAHASRVLPAQNRELAKYEGTMVLNGAYLVDADRSAEFREAAHATAADGGLRAEVTGPWPAYSFAVIGGEEA
ncbi:GvpL/GvpF family gas vesicle protein [Saccharopolyspora sp. NFXS83]|uniref:GvpL/GvpF family gas vesicle protein n=1 Tax=Saccharopolyspora sp. NFXS83 TaxID=2993560 RepID=UPI00224B5915|nr:GvpL/GvpF family gas vesicle protein [Saccharopolyspora sp. NFXS83]MCX2730493.1 GvpL/GvpF family gas vesicle protein [Saccharopolyspora sp. NFXS83]